jgi:pimeloyl-ACP methyl ester carboxylesterase
VLVPGLGLDARAWSRVLPRLTTASTVVTLPTMGRPASARADLRAPALARALAQELPRGAALVLVGHSASCQVVVELATHDPRVRALVLVGPTTDPAAATWPRIIGRWLRTARHEKAWEIPVLAPQYRRTGLASLMRGMDQLRRHRLDRALARVSVPVVVVRGEHDHIASSSWCEGLSRLSGGSVTTGGGAGHMVPLTHPQFVADAVVQVLT